MKLPRIHLPANVTKTQVISYAIFAGSAVILATTFYMNMNVDVLKDWRLVLPQQDIHAGDTIVVQSLYTKTMDVSGRSVRYVECRQNNGVFVRYPVSEAVSNRASGKAGTGITIAVPENIPNLPATCHVNITIDYEVVAWRHVIESTNTDDFTLLPERASSKSAGSEDEAQGSSQKQSGEASPQASADVPSSSSKSSSFSNSAPTTTQSPQEISQATGENTLNPVPEPVPQSQPGLLQGLVGGVGDLVIGVGCVVGGLVGQRCQ